MFLFVCACLCDERKNAPLLYTLFRFEKNDGGRGVRVASKWKKTRVSPFSHSLFLFSFPHVRLPRPRALGAPTAHTRSLPHATMGVTGLWSLLEPCGRRVNIETLAGKRIAVGRCCLGVTAGMLLACRLAVQLRRRCRRREKGAEGRALNTPKPTFYPPPLPTPKTRPSGCTNSSKPCATSGVNPCPTRTWWVSFGARAACSTTASNPCLCLTGRRPS